VALKKYDEEQIVKMSMIELAKIVLTEEKEEMKFLDLFEKVATLKQLTEAQRQDLLARFYTDLNVDGRFMTVGSNVWGLKRWYPVEQTTEKSLAESRKRDLEEGIDEALYDEELEEDAENLDDEIFDDIDQLEYDEDEDEDEEKE